MSSPQFIARVEQIYRDLDRYNYYELLNLQPGTLPDDVRRAYHRMALTLHPDRHHGGGDAQLKRKIYVIYKRIAEGYRVLMDRALRSEYDQLLVQGTLRLVKTERPKAALKRPEDAIDNPKARKFFSMGEDALRRGDKKGAKMNFKFALDLAEAHPLISERLKACEADDS